MDQLTVMRELLSSTDELGEDDFEALKDAKLELEYIVEETGKLVADNSAQVVKLDKLKKLLFRTYFRDARELNSEKKGLGGFSRPFHLSHKDKLQQFADPLSFIL